MANQELLFRLSMLEQKSKQIEEQINFVNQQILEMEGLSLNLKNIKSSKEKGILAGLGKGIFIKSEIKEKDLFVNIGGNIVVKKKIDGAQEIITNQISELSKVKENLSQELALLNSELQNLVEQSQKKEKD